MGATGKDFAIASGGACGANIDLAAGQSCTVNVAFTPAFAGVRNGAVQALDASGQILTLTYIHGSGIGPQISLQTNRYYQYTGVISSGYPFSTTTLSNGFSHPNVAVDGAGNVFEADLGTGAIEEIPAGCTSSSCVITILRAFYGPSALAVDGAGNLFLTEIGNNDVKKIPPGCRSITCTQTIGTGLQSTLRPEPGLERQRLSLPTPITTRSRNWSPRVATHTIRTLATGLDLPWSVVVNAAGDLFVAEGGDQCTVFHPGKLLHDQYFAA